MQTQIYSVWVEPPSIYQMHCLEKSASNLPKPLNHLKICLIILQHPLLGWIGQSLTFLKVVPGNNMKMKKKKKKWHVQTTLIHELLILVCTSFFNGTRCSSVWCTWYCMYIPCQSQIFTTPQCGFELAGAELLPSTALCDQMIPPFLFIAQVYRCTKFGTIIPQSFPH